LQPQHDGCVFSATHGGEEPEEHVGTVRLVHGQVTGVALDGRLQGFHLRRGSRLVDPARLYQGRQVKGPVANATIGWHCCGCPTGGEQTEERDQQW